MSRKVSSRFHIGIHKYKQVVMSDTSYAPFVSLQTKTTAIEEKRGGGKEEVDTRRVDLFDLGEGEHDFAAVVGAFRLLTGVSLEVDRL